MDLIEETVDSAIFLVESDGERDLMACFVGDVLQIEDELSGFFCRCW